MPITPARATDVSARARAALLVACHNDGATLRATIDSIRREPEIELFVVDDGSTDAATLEALSSLEGEGIRVERQTNSGPSSAWMRGLRATAAEYVMPFSSDDLLAPGAVCALADALDRHPDAAAAWGDMQTFGDANAYVPSPPVLCPWFVTYANVWPGIALFRRNMLLDVGGWQLTTGIEDWDLWLRLAARGYGGVHVAQPIFRYRRDAGGRFRGRVRRYEGFYEELQTRHAALVAARSENRARSLAPAAVKVLVPIIDRLPFLSRLVKVQLCDAVSLLLWRAGLRRTCRILVQGVLFRVRLVSARKHAAKARD